MAKDEKKLELRKKATIDMICTHVDLIDKSGEASERYRKLLTPMSLSQFDDFMRSLQSGEDVLYVNMPNLKKPSITFENNLKVAKSLGVEIFHQLKITDPKTGKRFLTPRKYAILHLPIRRQIQTIKSGISVAEDDNHINPTTGQVTGVSKAASISAPESFILYSKKLNKSIEELNKVRGGDTEAQRYAYNKLQQTGMVSLSELEQLDTRATSSDTLSTFFKAMHIDNNI